MALRIIASAFGQLFSLIAIDSQVVVAAMLSPSILKTFEQFRLGLAFFLVAE